MGPGFRILTLSQKNLFTLLYVIDYNNDNSNKFKINDNILFMLKNIVLTA